MTDRKKNPNGSHYKPGNMADDGSYIVGKGRPPRAGRFAVGDDRPRGRRPSGAKDLKTELAEELNEWVSITENGKTSRVRKRRVILKVLTAKAAKGDIKAADKIIDLHIQMFGFENRHEEGQALSPNDQIILERLLGSDNRAPSSPNDSIEGKEEGEPSDEKP